MIGVATQYGPDFRLVADRATSTAPCTWQIDAVYKLIATTMIECVHAIHPIPEGSRAGEAFINVTLTQLALPPIVACAAESIDTDIMSALRAVEARS